MIVMLQNGTPDLLTAMRAPLTLLDARPQFKSAGDSLPPLGLAFGAVAGYLLGAFIFWRLYLWLDKHDVPQWLSYSVALIAGGMLLGAIIWGVILVAYVL